jgi:hypothetical protein
MNVYNLYRNIVLVYFPLNRNLVKFPKRFNYFLGKMEIKKRTNCGEKGFKVKDNGHSNNTTLFRAGNFFISLHNLLYFFCSAYSQSYL